MQSRKPISAETLGQIALIQGLVAHLPDRESILKFVCRGLEIVPGTDKVSYRMYENKIDPKVHPEAHESATGSFQIAADSLSTAVRRCRADDRRAVCGKPLGDGLANSTACAGDQCDFAF